MSQKSIKLDAPIWKDLSRFKLDNDFTSMSSCVEVLLEVATKERMKGWWVQESSKLEKEHAEEMKFLGLPPNSSPETIEKARKAKGY